MTCVSIRCRNTGVSNWISVPSSGRSVVVVLPRLSKVHRLPSQSSSALAERVRFPPSPNPNGAFLWLFRKRAHTHFAARVRSADIEETPLNSSHRRRRTKAKEEVTRGSRKLKPITPPLKGKGLHTLLFLMRPFPHGVLDTSAESIPNFETKNKVLTHFLAMLTQFSARFRCETWIRGRNSVTF